MGILIRNLFLISLIFVSTIVNANVVELNACSKMLLEIRNPQKQSVESALNPVSPIKSAEVIDFISRTHRRKETQVPSLSYRAPIVEPLTPELLLETQTNLAKYLIARSNDVDWAISSIRTFIFQSQGRVSTTVTDLNSFQNLKIISEYIEKIRKQLASEVPLFQNPEMSDYLNPSLSSQLASLELKVSYFYGLYNDPRFLDIYMLAGFRVIELSSYELKTLKDYVRELNTVQIASIDDEFGFPFFKRPLIEKVLEDIHVIRNQLNENWKISNQFFEIIDPIYQDMLLNIPDVREKHRELYVQFVRNLDLMISKVLKLNAEINENLPLTERNMYFEAIYNLKIDVLTLFESPQIQRIRSIEKLIRRTRTFDLFALFPRPSLFKDIDAKVEALTK